ncbi:protein SENESCENCE-ASSOCIATED GENE 21, mitochondrial-like [Rhododendron vialii]|uniref:protein SENESCENCE-ASSOCIATED GENE 21, mitochondrial-like n=1 Tax=Rhododendron vialii TaxID=182163 RepID=UPI00265E4306|nr:protein SENESCENCE-ASSOCIATED GENE 21, mitochondrial-like [Rhododendron vialii]
MSKVPANAFLLLRKQAYSVGVENVRVQVVASASETRNNAVDSSTEDKGIAEQKDTTVDKEIMPLAGKKEEFWMRDPKTGNWIPETHINEVDAAELRDKFLPDKAKH